MSYTVITATLKTRTAIHIGSGQANGMTDALIRRDGAGQPVIPGTAIAGVLRSMLTRLGPRLGAGECVSLKYAPNDNKAKGSCTCGVCRLFGDINPSDEDNSQSEASRVLVFNAVLSSGSSQTAVRDGVGINRVTGAAARSGAVKFDLEVLPTGAAFNLRLELRRQDEQDEQLLAAALSEWQAGRAWLGGRVARGLGAFDLEDVQFKQLDLNDAQTLMLFLQSDAPHQEAAENKDWLVDTVRKITVAAPTEGENKHLVKIWFGVTATLQADGPLLTNDTTTSGLIGFDHAPLLAQWGDWNNPVLNGSGLRGVIRSHAERLARTLTTHTVNGKDEFLQQCPACSPVQSKAGNPLASCDSLLKKLGFSTNEEVDDKHLCLACRLFGSTWRGSRLIVEDAAYSGPHPPKLKMLDFLAIDRFTGGAADQAKFDALALWKPAFDLLLHLENPEPWELGWLTLVLRDLQSGWLAVGMGAAKGFGRVRLVNLKMTLGYLHPKDLGQFGLSEDDSVKSGIYQTRKAKLTDAKVWTQQFIEKVKIFKREDDLRLTADSYFNGQISELYKREETL